MSIDDDTSRLQIASAGTTRQTASLSPGDDIEASITASGTDNGNEDCSSKGTATPQDQDVSPDALRRKKRRKMLLFLFLFLFPPALAFPLIFGLPYIKQKAPSDSSNDGKPNSDIANDPFAIHNIVTFGDSYTDTGFNSSATPLPSAACPLGQPNCLQGRSYAGGHNWISALTTLYNQSVTATWNFARSGDSLDTALVNRPSILSRQLPEFHNVSQHIPINRNTLFAIFIGINDIGATWQNGQDPSSNAFLDAEAKSYMKVVMDLYDSGARKFLLLAVPDTTRTPWLSGALGADKPKVAAAIAGWNERLQRGIAQAKALDDKVEVYFWDSVKEFNKVLDDPKAYGFKDNFSQCDQPECFWHDGYHPNTYGQRLFGKSVAGLLAEGGWW
jgi:lysophospholipase L1-like esterase